MSTNVFVFGSNLAGIHGAGSALTAHKKYGATLGAGEGRRGDSYAIPTKDLDLKVLPLKNVEKYVKSFMAYASIRSGVVFHVVKIGCGLAGFKESEIAPLFAKAPPNVKLPPGWRKINKEDEKLSDGWMDFVDDDVYEKVAGVKRK